MNLPTPPTDNLYKFVALSGLIGVALCLYFPGKLLLEVRSSAASIYGEAAEIAVDLRFLEKDVERLEAVVERVEQALKKPVPSVEEVSVIVADHEESKRLLADVFTKQKAIAIKRAQLDAKHFALRQLNQQASFIAWIAVVGILLSISLAVWGFRRWYTHVQIVQDQLLKRDLALQMPSSDSGRGLHAANREGD